MVKEVSKCSVVSQGAIRIFSGEDKASMSEFRPIHQPSMHLAAHIPLKSIFFEEGP